MRFYGVSRKADSDRQKNSMTCKKKSIFIPVPEIVVAE
jgi:hypothetical protein